MKKGIALVGALLLTALASTAADAAVLLSVNGTVKNFWVRETGSYQGQVFILNGVNILGACYNSMGTGVFFRLPDNSRGDQMREVVKLAVQTGRALNAEVDDTVRDANNVCYVRKVQLF